MLIGRLGNDPESKVTTSGVMVVNFSLATSETWTKDGQRHEKTEWHRCVAWRKAGETIKQYCKKGSQLYVEGKLTTEKYQDAEGKDRYTTKIVVDQFQFLSSRNENGGHDSQEDNESEYQAPSNQAQLSASDDGDDIPF